MVMIDQETVLSVAAVYFAVTEKKGPVAVKRFQYLSLILSKTI